MRDWARREVLTTGAASSLLFPLSGALASPANKPDEASIAARLLSRYHPGLLRYRSGSQWTSSVDRFAAAWRATGSLEKKFLLLSELTASIRCSHTHCNPYNQPETAAAIMEGSHLLPLHFDWLGERMVVTRDPHLTGLEPGTEILSLGEVAPRDLLAQLLPLTRADGSLDNKRRALLSVTGAEYDTFDLFTAARRDFGETVELTVAAPGQAPRTVTISTIGIEERRNAMIAEQEAGSDPLWSLRMDGDVAVLAMPTWAVFNSSWDWKQWLESTFEKLSGVDRLVIDLRGNEGGLDACGAALLSYLAEKPFRILPSRSLTRVSAVAEEDRSYLQTWDESFFTIGESFSIAGPGFRNVPGDDEMVINPVGQSYRGRVAVLVDASNSSATGIFAEIVKREALATLIGQETGRSRRGGNGGAFFFAKLPESGLEFDIPLVGGFPSGDPPDAGTRPDFLVEKTPESIASGDDLELAVARSFLA